MNWNRLQDSISVRGAGAVQKCSCPCPSPLQQSNGVSAHGAAQGQLRFAPSGSAHGRGAGAQLRVSALAHGSKGRALGSALLQGGCEGDVGVLGESSLAGSPRQGWQFQQCPLSAGSPWHLGTRSDVHSPPAPSSAQPAHPRHCLLLAFCRPREPGRFLLSGHPCSTQPDLQTAAQQGCSCGSRSPRGKRRAHI